MSQRYSIVFIQNAHGDTSIIQQELNSLTIDVEVETLRNEAQLWASLEGTPPHLIISEYSRSGFSGVEILQEVREQYPNLPFIFVSGNIGSEKVIDLMRAGASDCIMKGNLERLKVVVPREIHNYRQRKKKQQELQDLLHRTNRLAKVT